MHAFITFVRTILEYCPVVLSPAFKKDIVTAGLKLCNVALPKGLVVYQSFLMKSDWPV